MSRPSWGTPWQQTRQTGEIRLRPAALWWFYGQRLGLQGQAQAGRFGRIACQPVLGVREHLGGDEDRRVGQRGQVQRANSRPATALLSRICTKPVSAAIVMITSPVRQAFPVIFAGVHPLPLM